MFGFFRKARRESISASVAPSLDSVSFDTTELTFKAQEPNRKYWHSTLGDGMAMYFFPKRPDIPNDLKSMDGLRAFYLSLLNGSSAKLVEVTTMVVGGCAAVRTIIKSPQQPHGMTYVGSLTLPFRDFSYVFKAQCEERGMTGMREAVLLDKHLREGKVTIEADGGIRGKSNPDDDQYDSIFPQHPLSRLRHLLRSFEASCVVDPAVASQPTFNLP